MRRLLYLLPIVLLCWSCTTESSDDGLVAFGPGSETTNGIVARVAGTPASYADVALRTANHKGDLSGLQNAMIVPDGYANGNGQFSLKVNRDEKVRLTVNHAGYAYSRIFSGDELFQLDTVELVPTASLSGRVDVPEGSTGLRVGVRGMDVLVRSDENGYFALPFLPAEDSLELYFIDDDDKTLEGKTSVLLDSYEAGFLNLKADVPSGADSVDVLDSSKNLVVLVDGKPAPYAMLAVRQADAEVDSALVENMPIVADVYANRDGKLNLPELDNGMYRVTVVQGGFGYSKVISAKNLSRLDTIELQSMATMSGKITLKSRNFYAWVGVKGLDVLVKTDDQGLYTLPTLPAKDTLELYFRDDSLNHLSVTQKVFLEPSATGLVPPVTKLQDFEGDLDEWYYSVDTVGSKLDQDDVSEAVEYDSSRKSKVFHGGYRMNSESSYSWVLVGTALMNEAWKFSALDSIVFYAKGKGQIRVAVENWNKLAEEAGYALKGGSEWMDMDAKQWTRFSVRPADLCYSAQEIPSCAFSWDLVKGYVRQLHFFARGGSDFYVDDIELYGILF